MKKIASLLFALCLPGHALAGEANWLTSFPEAADQARQENKLILLDFTGSDWCGWCQKLDETTFSKPEFADYADSNLVLVRLDFPRSKPQSDELKAANHALLEKYGVNGYPTLYLVDPDGKALWHIVGYPVDGLSAITEPVDACLRALRHAKQSNSSAAPGVARPLSPPYVAAAPVGVGRTQRLAPPPAKAGDEPKLQSILFSASHASAVLDGEVCREGDTVHGAHIIKIERDKVTVEYKGQNKVLKMN